MKRMMLSVSLTAVLSLAALAQTSKPPKGQPSSQTGVAQELMQMERDWSAAYLKHDPATVGRILADDYVGIDGRAIFSNKTEEMEEAKLPAPGTPPPERSVLDETISDMQVRVYGNAAVVTGLSTEKVQFKGLESTVRYRRTTVYVKRQGRWQCVSFHASRIIAPPK
jgi:ketosteroid isomerase-like protein